MHMLRAQQTAEPLDQVAPVMNCQTLVRIQEAVRQVVIDEALLGYLVQIVQATRSVESLEYGASPRGSLDLQRFSQAMALVHGRGYVLPDDIKQSARLVLPHRLITRKGTRSVTVSASSVIDHIVETIPVPI
jgi:MoxR-like ATPase